MTKAWLVYLGAGDFTGLIFIIALIMGVLEFRQNRKGWKVQFLGLLIITIGMWFLSKYLLNHAIIG